MRTTFCSTTTTAPETEATEQKVHFRSYVGVDTQKTTGTYTGRQGADTAIHLWGQVENIMADYSEMAVRAALEAAATAVGLRPDELEKICIGRTGKAFSVFLGEEPGDYRPSFYDFDNKILADAYDAGRKAQGDPRRANR